MAEFGQRLRLAREKNQMSQEKLAQEMNLTQASISQFEKGQRLPTPANIRKLAKILEVEEAYLAGDSEGKFERTALMRTITGLSPDELRQISKFAEFIKQDKNDGK